MRIHVLVLLNGYSSSDRKGKVALILMSCLYVTVLGNVWQDPSKFIGMYSGGPMIGHNECQSSDWN